MWGSGSRWFKRWGGNELERGRRAIFSGAIVVGQTVGQTSWRRGCHAGSRCCGGYGVAVPRRPVTDCVRGTRQRRGIALATGDGVRKKEGDGSNNGRGPRPDGDDGASEDGEEGTLGLLLACALTPIAVAPHRDRCPEGLRGLLHCGTTSDAAASRAQTLSAAPNLQHSAVRCTTGPPRQALAAASVLRVRRLPHPSSPVSTATLPVRNRPWRWRTADAARPACRSR